MTKTDLVNFIAEEAGLTKVMHLVHCSHDERSYKGLKKEGKVT